MSIPSIVYKAHATGNDFVVYLDEDGTHEPTADEVRFLCDRHFGIGGDGLIPSGASAGGVRCERKADRRLRGGRCGLVHGLPQRGRLAGRDVRQQLYGVITLFAQRQGIADQPRGGKPFHLGFPRQREDP